ncbi:type-F conjugative transfer system mating-pair stabilization protein TraN [Enterobacter hormaechei]|uniref:type-F conjugative transfer system mating-pair stabilization protein TraN n=1 Tax=Enterobacter hormaechei TaxID=158836 RepID=UPI00255130D8|nr:type-F conjugative transfer system mating-pair stabilization protein TraN [Enterobacter hormaechei]MDK9637891.1 type-F conjugative transfer system mating-pair stabilization protein TraN [Enterobacter hormaechei]
MKRAILMPVLALTATMVSVNASADADAQYRAGADFARQVQGQGESSLKNFNPSASIPNYTASPGEKKYYGGVTATGDGALKADGTTGWTTNEATKAVTDSFVNNPKEPISPDAPFIKASQDVQSRADTLIGKTGQTQCEAQNISRSEFTNYTCERDLLVEQACTRTASITGHYEDTTQQKTYTIENEQFTYLYDGNRNINFYFSSPASGTVLNAVFTIKVIKPVGSRYFYPSFWGGSGTFRGSSMSFSLPGAAGSQLALGGNSPAGSMQVSSCPSSLQAFCRRAAQNMAGNLKAGTSIRFEVTLTMQVPGRKWVPDVVWNESCPFSKSEGTLKKTECIEPGSTKTVVADGVSYPVTQACWKYKDTYMTQTADNGTCKTYMNNPACTLASRTCAFTAEDGSGCLHEYATYSCETRTSGQVMICGGDTFCLDGDCERAQNGKNNDFAPVVSALAALAAAGKDVAAINSVNVRAFTGSAKFCKKFAAGFSNCCKDGGWGQDVGLARCSSEEKALGKAKENKLTVSIGEFCSKKVLGVCIEKKRGYCQFDSKLAQIVQQQGRNGQLHIGFGKASSPDCRGITQTELQQINFEALDFSNFFDDLQKNKKIPDNDTLTKRVREEIAAQLKNKQ